MKVIYFALLHFSLAIFISAKPGGHRVPASRVMESSFEDSKPYVLTALGKQFVHYVMEDVAPQIGRGANQPFS